MTVSSKGREVVEVEHCWVPMPDGCRLAARLWLPAGVPRGAGEPGEPVPAVVEAIPYGKRWGTRWRDEPLHGALAARGYASVRLDVRGSGDSDGVLADEYLPREQEDLVAALAWVAAQPWCDGSVALLGKSWGGFAALQAAARRPPALKAVVSVCASDDRYADDAHYMGGCLLMENLVWGAALLTLTAEPPDPAVVGDGWRDTWAGRLAATAPAAATWLVHPHRDAYWQQGSVAEDPAAVGCPVFLVGGWADAYTNAIPRLLCSLPGPRRGLVGPWAHRYPHNGVPGPALDFPREVARWLDRWLRPGAVPAGSPEPPLYQAWMPEWAPPRDFHLRRPGRWVAEEAWPPPSGEERRLHLAPEGLRPAGAGARPPRLAAAHRSPQSVGERAGSWCPFGYPGELPGDQGPDDARSLTFDSAPLEERTELWGTPRVLLRLAADRPVALVAARLVDLAPDGSASRITYGLLNLTHRDGHERPAPLVPGDEVEVTVPLNHVAWAVLAGHRLRLALSTAYWPIAWPPPEPVTLSVLAGEVVVPVRPPRPEDDRMPPLPRARAGGGPLSDPERDPARFGTRRDPATGEVTHWWETGFAADGSPELEEITAIGLEVGHGMREEARIHDDDPLSAAAEVRHHLVLQRGGWRVEVATRSRLTATATHFRLRTDLEAREGDRVAARRRWDQRVPRRLV